MRIVEIILAAAVGLIAARAFWAIFAPLPAPAVQPAAAGPLKAGPTTVADPFAARIAGAAVSTEPSQDAVETTLALTLFGTWADGDGKGTAVIQHSGGPQKKFAVGDVICCGARLVEVHADRVVILRSGVRETLRLPNKLATRAAGPAAPAAAPPTRVSPSSAVLTPIIDADGVFSLMLLPGSDPTAFAALGLQSGDRLVAINGGPVPANAGEVAAFLTDFAGVQSVTATVDRAGARLSVEIPTSAFGGISN